MNASLFDNFDSIKEKIRKSKIVDVKSGTTAIKRKNRHLTRRAKSEEVLRSVLPDYVDTGDSYHVISSGDVDSMSFMTFYMVNYTFDDVLISTWVIADSDIDNLIDLMKNGRIKKLKLCLGEIYPGTYPAEYSRLLKMRDEFNFQMVVARNHSKIMLMKNSDMDLVIESSANVNTNPRMEQTAIHNDKGLYDFYNEFFAGVKSIDRYSSN